MPPQQNVDSYGSPVALSGYSAVLVSRDPIAPNTLAIGAKAEGIEDALKLLLDALAEAGAKSLGWTASSAKG